MTTSNVSTAQQHYGTSPNAMRAMALGLATTFVFLFLAPISAPLCIWWGIKGLKETKPKGPYEGRGMAVIGTAAGVWLTIMSLAGLVGLVLTFFVLVPMAAEERETVMADFELVKQRAKKYADSNNGSLLKGGTPPVASVPDIERQNLMLVEPPGLFNLVRPGELAYDANNVPDGRTTYTFEVTGPNSFRVTNFWSEHTMVVEDLQADKYSIRRATNEEME